MDFDDFISAYSSPVQEIARTARQLILQVFPDALEIVDQSSGLVAYGHGRRYADMAFTIQPFSRHVNLGIYRAVLLAPRLSPDAAALLEGTGKLHRHVRLNQATDAASPALRSLLQIALVEKDDSG